METMKCDNAWPIESPTKTLIAGDYIIPEGFSAEINIEGRIVVVRQKESDYERMRKEIVDFIRWAVDRGSITNAQRERSDSWLAYLEKQKEKSEKPIIPEWSEEDEKMLNLIIAIFEVNHPNGCFKANELGTTDMRGVHTEEIISWLKSLRPQPQWKPSEEQMDALMNMRFAVEKFGPSASLAALNSLYNDLKNL